MIVSGYDVLVIPWYGNQSKPLNYSRFFVKHFMLAEYIRYKSCSNYTNKHVGTF